MARNKIIGIRVDDDMEQRLNLRALRVKKTLSTYCYDLIHKDVYRDKTDKVICPMEHVCDVDKDRLTNTSHCHPHKYNKNCNDEIGCWLKDSKCIPVYEVKND